MIKTNKICSPLMRLWPLLLNKPETSSNEKNSLIWQKLAKKNFSLFQISLQLVEQGNKEVNKHTFKSILDCVYKAA